MKTKIIFNLIGIVMGSLMLNMVQANDSTGYVATSGVQYLKNKDIQMYSEDLYISKKIIKVDYQFKNLSNKDIKENILFPLPKVENFFDSDFADTEGLLKSFQVKVDGKKIQPSMHVRAYLQLGDWLNPQYVDVTTEFKQCGFTQQDLLNPWTRKVRDSDYYWEKVQQCKHPKLKKYFTDNQGSLEWSSEVIYSWPQTFKAGAMTRVQHEYRPLVGGSVAMYLEQDAKDFCMDRAFLNGLKKKNAEHAPIATLGYILTTGANWAKPIQNFKLTIERDASELISLCWDGKIKKISPTRFQIQEKKFTPQQDLNILFLDTTRRY